MNKRFYKIEYNSKVEMDTIIDVKVISPEELHFSDDITTLTRINLWGYSTVDKCIYFDILYPNEGCGVYQYIKRNLLAYFRDKKIDNLLNNL